MIVSLRAAAACVALTGLSVTVRAAEIDEVIVEGARIRTSLEETADNGALGSKKLLDTPFSITVVDANELTRRQVNSVAQIFANDPSIFSASPSGTTPWWGAQMRGLPVRNYYIDGVPLMMSYGGEFPLEPIERVEGLKGLAGFMYGFGEPGGIISYETKKPTDQPLTATIVEFRNPSALSLHVDTGGRLADDGLGYRINISRDVGEAYSSAELDRTVASVALDYPLAENVEWFASAVYEDSKLTGEPLYFYWDIYPEDTPLPRATYDYEDVSIGNGFYDANTLNATSGVNWRINDAWRAKVSLGYNRQEHLSNKMFGYLLNEAGDYEGSAYNFAGLLKNQIAHAIVQGDVSTGPIRHELVVGTEARRATEQWGNEWYWENDFNGNIYERQTFRVTRDIDFSLAPMSSDIRQKGLFASDTLHFGEQWQALIGLRYTVFEIVDLDDDPDVDSRYATDELTPTVALIFKPASYVSVYASYVESLEGGSRVGEDYANFGELLGATVSKQYEVGTKYERSRLSFTGAVFRIERAGQIDEFRDGLRYLTQDGMTQYDGVEAMGSFNITRDLAFGLGATYLDAQIDEVSEENAELKGKQPAGLAKWQAVANVDYRVPQLPGLNVFANVRYIGDAYYEDLNRVTIPKRTLASAGLQYQTEIAGRRTQFMGSINNLLNKKYWEMNTLGEGINGSLSMQVFW